MLSLLKNLVPAPYRWVLWLVAAAAIFGLGFYVCHQFNKADQVGAARAETKQVIKQAGVSNVIADKHETANIEIRTVYKTIIKEVPKYVTVKTDAGCPIPNSFVSVWNSASAGAIPDSAAVADDTASAVKLSGVAEQHIEDSEQYYLVAERLSALQQWVREQQKIGR